MYLYENLMISVYKLLFGLLSVGFIFLLSRPYLIYLFEAMVLVIGVLPITIVFIFLFLNMVLRGGGNSEQVVTNSLFFILLLMVFTWLPYRISKELVLDSL